MINRLLKISIILICVIFISFNINTTVHAYKTIITEDPNENPKTESTDSGSWVTDAFSAASSFFSENVTDEMGIIEKPLDLFSDLVKAINTILFVILAGISAISLSIVGIRYIVSISRPTEVEKAKKDLHQTVRGMMYGFGAFFIWQIAMSIVGLIINGMGTSSS